MIVGAQIIPMVQISVLRLGLGLVWHTDIMSYMSPHVFLTYSFQWRMPLVILRYMAHLDSSNKLFFIVKKQIEKTALVTQNHHFKLKHS